MTLCGQCVGTDVPGNVLFGFIAAAAGVSSTIRDAGAAWGEAWDWDGERDITALWLGDEDKDVFPLGDLSTEAAGMIYALSWEIFPGTRRADANPALAAAPSSLPNI